jgi:hypothetical protein
MPVKLGQSVRKIVRGAARPSFEYTHDYIKVYSNGALIEKYNASSTKKRDKRKIKIELERRNKLGKANVVFG